MQKRRFNWFPSTIIFAAMALAGYWVFLVPILQSPDEDSHADYVFCLYSRGGLIQGTGAPMRAWVHPFIPYLQSVTNANFVGFRPFVKMPSGYGTKAFFSRLNSNAPNNTVNWQTYPFRLVLYPVGYYALTALWLSLVSHLNSSLTFLFFSARIFSVLLLGGGLAFSYLTMRELGLSRQKSSLILAALGFFPLVSFVGSYIQPDNLALISISACFYFALRWRNELVQNRHDSKISSRPTKMIWLLSFTLAILFLSKYHFFCCVGFAVFLMVIATSFYSRISLIEQTIILAKLAIPSLLAYALQFWVSGNCRAPYVVCSSSYTEWLRVVAIGGRPLISHIINALYDQAQSLYSIDGQIFRSFWGEFGWLDTPLIIISQRVNDFLRTAILTITLIVFSLSLASLVKVALVALRLFKKRHLRSALYLICSNPVITSYFFFIPFMFLFNIIFYPTFTGNGRHWFPLILSIILEAAFFAPRIFTKPAIRQLFFFLLVISWLIYSLLGSYYAISCIQKRYYEPDHKPFIDLNKLETTGIVTEGRIQHCDFLDFVPNHANTLIMPKGVDMDIVGWAVDEITHTPALTVLLYIDGNKIYQPTYGMRNQQAMETFHDRKYQLSGFATLISTKDLDLGWHTLTMKVVSKNGLYLYKTKVNIRFIVIGH